jgi:hypothetical protein
MSAGYYEMDPDLVQSSGRQVHDLEPQANSAVHSVLGAYTSGAAAVVHAKVQAALTRFHDTHQKTHRAVPHAVASLGANTARGGKAVADGTNESTHVQMASLTTQQGAVTSLRRPITS